jgi:hypothetical protein
MTIGVSLTFSLIGLWALKGLNSSWTFPILFGISIPLANWDNLGVKRIQKLIVIGTTALGLFFIGLGLSIWVTNLHLNWLAIMISGIIAVLFLLVNSAFIENLKPQPWTYLLTFLLCSVAFPLGTRIIELLSGLVDRDMIFLFWTFLFTVGLVTGLVNKNTVGNNMHHLSFDRTT